MLPEPGGDRLVERVSSDAERARLGHDVGDPPAVPSGLDSGYDLEKMPLGRTHRSKGSPPDRPSVERDILIL